MAMVSMNSLLNGKDSRWLQLEVCREFQRNKCSRTDVECKFAHPPANVEVQNGRVTACYDSIKGRCNREKPPCKYFHPPQHLKDQLLINGRNHLALKNALMQQMGLAPGQVLPAQLPTVVGGAAGAPQELALQLPLGSLPPLTASNPYLAGVPAVGSGYGPYFAAGPLVPALVGHDPGSAVPSALAPSLPQQVIPASAQKLPRSDRLEMDMKTVGSFYYENFAFPGMVPYKRAAADKSGVPVYQPATTYQQLMQLQQQPFVPVSCEYPAPAPPAAAETRPPSVHAPPPASPPAPSPDPAAVAKEVAQSNYAAKLAAAAAAAAANAHHNPPVSVSPVTALSYTGVALNKQASAPPSRTALTAATPPLVYRQPPSFMPQFNPLLRSHLHSQLQSQLQAQQQQLQNQLAQLPQLPSQMGGQIPAHLAAQMSAQYNSAMSGQAGVQWAMPAGMGGLPPHLMGPAPGLYQQQLLYQMPPQGVPTSSPAVIVNPYKKMKTT